MSEFYGHKKKPRAVAKAVLMYPESKQSGYLTANSAHYPYDYHLGAEWNTINEHFMEASHDYLVHGNALGRSLQNRETMRDREIQNLRRIVSLLLFKMSKIESQTEEEDATEVRELSVKEAKPIVQDYLKKYLKEHKNVYPSDVCDALGLSYQTVIKVFRALEKEGKLKAGE